MNSLSHLSDAELKQRDRDHLRLLAIFHFVFGGLMLLGIGFIFLHYFFMRSFFGSPELWRSPGGSGTPPPKEILDILLWFYVLGGFFVVIGCVLNVLSGIFLLQRKYWTFTLVIAALNCLQVPFGTALGVFTIIVLQRESIKKLYKGVDAYV